MAYTNMTEIVAGIADYIEDHIRERISLDEIAGLVYLSKYHLDRIFKGITGLPLMEYVRARKLAHSLNLLVRTDLRILDVAMEYRFSHEQSYARAFRSTFGTSPGEFRRDRTALRIQEKLDHKSLQELGPGILIKPVIVLKPEFYVIGLPTLVDLSDDRRNHVANRLGLEFYYRHCSRIENAVRRSVYIGLVRYLKDNEGATSYMPSLEVDGLSRIPAGMAGEVIPANKYAVFKYIGLFPPDQVNVEAMAEVYPCMDRWLHVSGHERAGAYHFEWIDTEVAREDYCEVDNYLPIR